MFSEKYFKLLATTWAAAVVMATLFAVNYHFGFVRGFGFPEVAFSMDWQNIALLAHRSLLSVWGNYIFPLIDEPAFIGLCAFVGFLAVVLFFLNNLKTPKTGLSPRQHWWKDFLTKKWVIRPLVVVWSAMTAVVLFRAILLTLALFLVLPLVAYKSGKLDAAKFLSSRPRCDAALQKGDDPCSTLILKTVDAAGKDAVVTLRGRVVVGNEKWIGLVTDTESVALPMTMVRYGIAVEPASVGRKP
ncbi:hypothetical protein ABE85_02120 [Mitsuaria sp. 7]|nr:hypothetical protein ABE85_02120 [Mitsuaria sp. 7]